MDGPGMSRRYRDKTEECLIAAENISDVAARTAMLKVAGCYLLLADYITAREDQSTAQRPDAEVAHVAEQHRDDRDRVVR
jgi:hypothetical protein